MVGNSRAVIKIWRPGARSPEPPAIETPVDYDAQFIVNYATTLTATFVDGWPLRSLENAANNPTQVRSYVEIIEDEGEYVFRGLVNTVDRAHPQTAITGMDKLAILGETLARYKPDSNLYNVWARYTGSEDMGNVQLYPGFDYTGGPYNIWYPKFNSSAWITAGASLAVTLPANFTNGDNAIDIGTSDDAAAAPPSGFAFNDRAGTIQAIQYSGKAWDEANSTYKIYNCKYGRLGSVAANGTLGDTLSFRFAKRIHFDRAPRVQGYDGSVYETINPEGYDVLAAEGGFGFKQDPLNLRRKTSGATDVFTQIWANGYNTYAEEDAAKYLRLSDILTDLAAITAAEYGAGLTFDIDIDPDIVLTRVECPRSTSILDFIRGLLSDTNLLKGEANDALAIWYDPQADTICIKSIAQLTASTDSGALHYGSEASIVSSADMENVYSAVACDYQEQNAGNLLASRRIWHTIGAGPPYVWHLSGGSYTQAGAAYGGTDSSINLLYPVNTRLVTLLTAVGDGNPDLLMDNNSDTGFAIGWDAAADARGKKIYFWPAGANEYTPASVWFGEVGFAFDMTSATAGGNSPRFTVKYFTDLVPSNDAAGTAAEPTSVAGAKYMDARLTLEYGGGVINEPTRVLAADGMLIYGNGICLVIDEPLEFTVGGSTKYGVKIKDVFAHPPTTQTVIHALRASYTTAATNYTTAPETYAKIQSYLGVHKVGILTVGGTSKQSAEWLAFLQLLAGLVQAQSQTYDISSKEGLQWHGCPKLVRTAFFSDGFSGVVDSFTLSRRGGVRSVTGLRAVNFLSGVFGQAV